MVSKNKIGGSMNSTKGFFGYNQSSTAPAAIPTVANTTNTASGSSSYLTTIIILLVLFGVIFAGIYIYFKTFGYTLQMGWDKLMGKFEDKEQINVSLNERGESSLTTALVPPPSDEAESKKLKELIGLSSAAADRLPFDPEERPSGMPGAKESPSFLEKAAREIKKTFGPDQQVFNVSRNVYSYDDAAPLCKAMGAELATYDQLLEAQKHGADWCNYGWVKGQMAAFPVQEQTWNKLQTGPAEHRNSCGKPGINGGYFDNPELRFGVNCFGPRPQKKDTDELLTDNDTVLPPTADEIEFNKKVYKFKEQMNSITVLPWNRQKWQGT
jgi:hypothetical protein